MFVYVKGKIKNKTVKYWRNRAWLCWIASCGGICKEWPKAKIFVVYSVTTG